MQKINFQDTECLVDLTGMYTNGRQAIQLIEEETKKIYCIASVNIPDYPLEEGKIIIKDYSENEGILSALLESKVVTCTGKFASSGWVICPIIKLRKS